MESSESFDILVEKATPEDTRGIQELLYRTWLATYPNEAAGITRDDIEDRFKDRFSEERLEKRMQQFTHPPDGEVWLVAKKAGVVVGVVSPIQKQDRNQLQRIYVHPDYQRTGVGTKLWEEAQKYLDPAKDTYVEVVEYNTDARHFYENLGFKDTGRRWQSKNFAFKSGAIFPEMEMVLTRV